jgi:hypothetical protein
MPSGAGNAPAGSSSAGYGVPDVAPNPLTGPLPDLRTGQPCTGRFLDPITKDYRFASDGRLLGMGTVPQLVQLALTTTFGSSCIPSLGQRFTLIQEKGANFSKQLTSAITNCLSDLVTRKLVQIVSVTATDPGTNPDAGLGVLQWLDLTTGIEQPTTIGQ